MSTHETHTPFEQLFDRPKTVGSYSIKARLTTGRRTIVYLGFREGAPFVLRELRDGFDPAAFEREITGAGALRVGAPLQPIIRSEGRTYAACPAVMGESLATILDNVVAARRPISLEIALAIASGIAQRLEDLGGQRVHGDLIPHHVLIGYDGSVELIDPAGNAAVERAAAADRSAYRSPEHVRSSKIGQSSDLFNLGILLYELTTGHRLFGGNEDPGRRIIESTPPRPIDVAGPSYPIEVQLIIRKLLRPADADRFQAPRAVRDALRVAAISRAEVEKQQLAAWLQHAFKERFQAWRKLVGPSLLPVIEGHFKPVAPRNELPDPTADLIVGMKPRQVLMEIFAEPTDRIDGGGEAPAAMELDAALRDIAHEIGEELAVTLEAEEHSGPSSSIEEALAVQFLGTTPREETAPAKTTEEVRATSHPAPFGASKPPTDVAPSEPARARVESQPEPQPLPRREPEAEKPRPAPVPTIAPTMAPTPPMATPMPAPMPAPRAAELASSVPLEFAATELAEPSPEHKEPPLAKEPKPLISPPPPAPVAQKTPAAASPNRTPSAGPILLVAAAVVLLAATATLFFLFGGGQPKSIHSTGANSAHDTKSKAPGGGASAQPSGGADQNTDPQSSVTRVFVSALPTNAKIVIKGREFGNETYVDVEREPIEITASAPGYRSKTVVAQPGQKEKILILLLKEP